MRRRKFPAKMLSQTRHTFSSKSSLSYSICRYIWLNSRLQAQETQKADFHIYNDPPKKITKDMIGPAHPESNIRGIKLYKPENESYNHKRFREMRQDTHQWNHLFWAKHNRCFFQEKEEYVKRKLAEKKKLHGLDADLTLSPEELSTFYYEFLDKNYKLHVQYNKEWYKRNLRLLWPAFLVLLENMTKKIFRKHR